MKRPLRSLHKGSDYCETKIIVSFQTAITFIYSLFVFIFISIIFHIKQRINFHPCHMTSEIRKRRESNSICSPYISAWLHYQFHSQSRRVVVATLHCYSNSPLIKSSDIASCVCPSTLTFLLLLYKHPSVPT